MNARAEAACDGILKALGDLGIPYDLLAHDPVWDFGGYAPIGEKLRAVVLKNLLLTTRRRGGLWLYVTLPETPFRAGPVSAQAGTSRLCLAPEEALAERLRTFSGAVSPLELLFDPAGEIALLLDQALRDRPRLAFHPGRNDRTVALRREDFLEVFLPATGHGFTWIDPGRDG